MGMGQDPARANDLSDKAKRALKKTVGSSVHIIF